MNAATPPSLPAAQDGEWTGTVPLDPVAVTARLRAIPGVTDVFPPSRRLARVVDALTADIGTSRDRRTPETASEVADVLLAEGGPNTTVTVRVSRIS